MLGTVVIILFLLPMQTNGLVTAKAKCLAGFDWMFSSIGQSPCDVAEELLEVCSGPGTFPLAPLPADTPYGRPSLSSENSCFCSSVVYSLLSACELCQQRPIITWSVFHTDCTMAYVGKFVPPIPDGVKVPAYAYLNVSIIDQFDSGLAQSKTGPESSRLPPSSTAASSPSDTGDSTTINNTPAIIGGVVGGVIGLGLVAVLITFLVLRSKQKPTYNNYDSNSRRPNKGFIPDTSVPSSPGSPELTDVAEEKNTFPSTDPGMYDPHRQHSPPVNRGMTPEETYTPLQMQTDECLKGYSGMPEL